MRRSACSTSFNSASTRSRIEKSFSRSNVSVPMSAWCWSRAESSEMLSLSSSSWRCSAANTPRTPSRRVRSPSSRRRAVSGSTPAAYPVALPPLVGLDLLQVEVAERRGRVAQLRHLLGELRCLGKVVVLHRHLVRGELDHDDVGVGLVAVLGDHGPARRPLALGLRPPLVGELVDLVVPAGLHLDDLHETCHGVPLLESYESCESTLPEARQDFFSEEA